jgi:hypothetical protein
VSPAGSATIDINRAQNTWQAPYVMPTSGCAGLEALLHRFCGHGLYKRLALPRRYHSGKPNRSTRRIGCQPSPASDRGSGWPQRHMYGICCHSGWRPFHDRNRHQPVSEFQRIHQFDNTRRTVGQLQPLCEWSVGGLKSKPR